MGRPQWQEALDDHLMIGNSCDGDGAEALIEQEPNGTFVIETKYTEDRFRTTDPSSVTHVLEEFDIPLTGWQ